jgi:hypothetical protein
MNLFHLDQSMLNLLLLLVVVLHPEGVVEARFLFRLGVLIVLRVVPLLHQNQLVEVVIYQLNHQSSIYRRWLSMIGTTTISFLWIYLFHHPVHLIILQWPLDRSLSIFHLTTNNTESRILTVRPDRVKWTKRTFYLSSLFERMDDTNATIAIR